MNEPIRNPQCIAPGRGEPVIDPYMLGGDFRLQSDRVLFVLTPRLFRKAVHAAERVESLKPCPGIVRRCKLLHYRRKTVVLVHAWWGAPASVASLEDVIASGAKHIVALGIAGSISPRARIGDIVVPLWGIREEGTSYHYATPDYTPKPSNEMVEALTRVLRRLGVNPLMGGVWTTDAI